MFANYITALYSIVGFLCVTEGIELIIIILRDMDHGHKEGVAPWPADWLRFMAAVSPFVVLFSILLSYFHSRVHLHEIYEGRSVWLHERALSILAMPPVCGIMAMEAMVQMYTLLVEEADQEPGSEFSDTKHVAMASFDTILYVGLVYLSWGLYQFGKLTTDLLAQVFTHSGLRDDNERQVFQRAQLSFSAVADVLWVGCGMFLLLVMAATGWTFVLWITQPPEDHWDSFDRWLRQYFFSVLTASAGAIYNMHKVEQTFGHLVQEWYPFLKFLQVKMLVFFSCWQLGIFKMIVEMKIIDIEDTRLKLFNAVVLTWECLFCVIINMFAWPAEEPWYQTYELTATRAEPDEKTLLLGKGS